MNRREFFSRAALAIAAAPAILAIREQQDDGPVPAEKGPEPFYDYTGYRDSIYYYISETNPYTQLVPK